LDLNKDPRKYVQSINAKRIENHRIKKEVFINNYFFVEDLSLPFPDLFPALFDDAFFPFDTFSPLNNILNLL